MTKYTAVIHGKTIQRRSPAPSSIPEELNKTLRTRLKLARESSGKMSSSFLSVSSSMLNSVEGKDISSLKLGHLYGIAQEIGWDFCDMLKFLAGEGTLEVPDGIIARRVVPYVGSLPEDLQNLAVDLIQRLVEYNAEKNNGITARSLHISKSST